MGVRTSSKQSTARASAVASTAITTTTSVSAPVIGQIYYTDSSYNNTALTAIDPTGGYIKIIGTGFQAGSTVYVGGQTSNVVTTTFVSSTEIRIQVAALAAAKYSLMVFNTNNSGAIYESGVVSSTVPAWTVAAGTVATVTETVNVSNLVTAPSNSPVTYSITAGALPAGVLLDSSTGRLSGTAPTVVTQTIYTFTVTAIDAELQTASREYSYTITPDVITWNSPADGETLTGYNGFAFSLPLSASSAAGKTVTYTADVLPPGLNISGSSIIGAPSTLYSAPSVLTGTTEVTGKTATRTVNWNIVQPLSFMFPTAGRLFDWGRNETGQLGDGTTQTRSSPVQVGADATWVNFAGGNSHSVGLKNDGTIWDWGYRPAAAGGNRSSPVQVGTSTTWRIMAAGVFHVLGITGGGTLWAWGLQQRGELGLGVGGQPTSPIQVGTLSNWLKLSAGGYNSAAIKTDGTLWTWGLNDFGQLGLGDTFSRSSPVQVGALTSWSSVSMAFNPGKHMLAIKTNGTLWSWGRNNIGGLGIGDTIHRSSPIQVGVLTNWLSVSAGTYGSSAIKTDNTLWSWGYNTGGRLGDGTIISKSSPVQVGTGYSNVIRNANNGIATKTNGTLWAWGFANAAGNSGVTGDGTTIARSAPVQIGALTTWLNVVATENSQGAIRS